MYIIYIYMYTLMAHICNSLHLSESCKSRRISCRWPRSPADLLAMSLKLRHLAPVDSSMWSECVTNPDLWGDAKSRFSLGIHNLHHRSFRAQNWGIYFCDPPGGQGRCMQLRASTMHCRRSINALAGNGSRLSPILSHLRPPQLQK